MVGSHKEESPFMLRTAAKSSVRPSLKNIQGCRMPYLVVPIKEGFKVKKEGARKYFSKKPLTKATAEAQRRALYASERKK